MPAATPGLRQARANFGHLAFRVADIYATCERLQAMGYAITAHRATGTWRSCVRPTWGRHRIAARTGTCRRAAVGLDAEYRQLVISARAWARSAIRSSASSSPTEIRSRFCGENGCGLDRRAVLDQRFATASEVALVEHAQPAGHRQRCIAATAQLDAHHSAEIAHLPRGDIEPGCEGRPGQFTRSTAGCEARTGDLARALAQCIAMRAPSERQPRSG